MPVNVIRFRQQGRASWGVAKGLEITPIPGDFSTTRAFLEANDVQSLARLKGPTLKLADVELLSPVTENQQFLCQGANYRQHMIESGLDPGAKTFNMIFTKATSCLAPADTDVVKPARVQFLDYEIELGLVLKRDVTSATEIVNANLSDFVAGLTIVNDYSARDVQIPQMQFYKGKSFRTFGPVGPYLCLTTPDDLARLGDLQLRLTVNGEIRQKDFAANLVFGPAETLTELSAVQNLYAGDLIATGTPAGCALSVPSPGRMRFAALLPERAKWRMFLKVQAGRTQYLKPGDLVEARIATLDGLIDLGAQRNRVVVEAPNALSAASSSARR